MEEISAGIVHNTPASVAEDPVQAVKSADLINLFNYVNFREGTVFVGFTDPSTGESLSFPAFPQPTAHDLLVCRWLSPGLPARVLASFQLKGVVVNDGQHVVLLEGQTVSIDREQVVLRVPEFGSRKLSRTVVRYRGQGVTVEVLQNGFQWRGSLVDFSAVSFAVELTLNPGESFHGLNTNTPVTVLLQRGDFLHFSGDCQIVRQQKSGNRGLFVFSLSGSNVQRFAPKEFRSVRQVLSPAPQVSFSHPLSGKSVSLLMTDLSGGGFCVEEHFESSCLFSGLILPHLSVELGGHHILETSGQVLYRNVNVSEEIRKSVRCGVTFLDMALADQARLATLIHQAKSSNLRVSSPVNMDELWRFFFESGFLYPSKYVAIEESKQQFKRVYDKLYLKSPDITRHFLYQDKGVLSAHGSMLRAYPEAWLIHHHAASKDSHLLAGVAVLDQAGQYFNEFHSHPSTHMAYVMCYYRRENKFPDRVFGGSANAVGDPKGISLDEFSYLHLNGVYEDSGAYQILPASNENLQSLSRFYEITSGGLMLDAMNLRPPILADEELSERYAALGFRRKHMVFSFYEGGVFKAIITLQLTELGLNLSNLTNCFHALVIDSSLDPQILLMGLSRLGQQYTQEELPLLVYPSSYLDNALVPVEKNYTLWVLSMSHLDHYFRSIQKRFRRRGD